MNVDGAHSTGTERRTAKSGDQIVWERHPLTLIGHTRNRMWLVK